VLEIPTYDNVGPGKRSQSRHGKGRILLRAGSDPIGNTSYNPSGGLLWKDPMTSGDITKADQGLLAIKSRRVDRDGTSMLRRRGVSDEEQAAQAEAASLDRAT
jgi:hypothetical protein